jgi:YHS domain-containing protein
MAVKPQDSDTNTLTDPVCGRPMATASAYRFAHGGAMFYFCSDACRSRFVADPSRYVGVHVRPSGVATAVHLVVPPVAKSSGAPASPSMGKRAVRNPVRELEYVLRGLISSWLLAWRERRHAAQTSRAILALYHTLSADHPKLARRVLYRLVVMAYMRSDSHSADKILDQAEESFAEWPVTRALTLRDVAHYLTVNEYLHLHGEDFWFRSEVQEVVATHIPHDL